MTSSGLHPGYHGLAGQPAWLLTLSSWLVRCLPDKEIVIVTDALLADKIANHTARISIIGQGYVGLPLAVEFARAGFSVTGLDTNLDHVGRLNRGQSHSPDVDSAELSALVEQGRYRATGDFDILKESDAVILTLEHHPHV